MATTTIDEIAQLAGVSKATVSRVVNRSPRVAPEVSQKVTEVIKKIGYQPAARRSGPRPTARAGIRTGNVLLLVLGFPAQDRYGMRGYPDILHGVEETIRKHGLKLLLASLDADGVIPAGFSPSDVDGALLFGRSEVLTSAARARLKDIPAVGLMRGFDDLAGEIDRVIFDNAAVGPMAARYLLNRGHKRVAFYSIDPSHTAMIPRERDFTAVNTAANASVVSLVSESHPEGIQREIAAHHALVKRLVEANRQEKVTGLFVPSGYWAPYAYQALLAHDIVPGKDIDFLACDNTPLFMDQLSPRPATIDINLSLVGARGVEQLLWRMANPTIQNRTRLVIEPILVPGEISIPLQQK